MPTVRKIMVVLVWFLLIFFLLFRSPYTVSCLAPYGGPIQPQLAVGGGVFTNYTDSTGIGLTFLVNNQKNEKQLEPALKWEKE